MSLIQAVNEKVSIAQACRWAEVDVPDGFGNRKTWCPFGITHPDGGVEAALRLYEDTNSMHCFACAKSWRPVSLMAEFWDCSALEAAGKISQMTGVREPTWQDQWEALHQPAVPDRDALAEALKTWCRRVRGPSWDLEQLTPRFSVPLGECLSLLPLVSNAEEASEFLVGCKVVMSHVLRGDEDGR